TMMSVKVACPRSSPVECLHGCNMFNPPGFGWAGDGRATLAQGVLRLSGDPKRTVLKRAHSIA
ncbi:MAG: hypothetical protein LC808_11795, partial [Actinobacteria bacterium]|nr:hypothetical protein [Actinomycetota bacterium]